jgi:Nif-specific regulatory protein
MTTLRVDADVLADLRKDRAVTDAAEEIAASFEGIRDTETLLVRLLDGVFACIPAERGAVLLAGRNGGDLEPAMFRGNPFALNREICNSAFHDRTATILNNSGSALCVPLFLRRSNVGAIYLDAPKRPKALTVVHLRLLIAIAAEAALAIDFTRYIDTLQVQQKQLIGYAGVDKGIIGSSPRIAELLKLIYQFAATESKILILGETGTGKELVARAIHEHSRRKKGPCIAINCAAIPETLIASELFGYEPGAFTGAVSQTIGKVEAANGGTLFLDEIAEITMPMQALLLRLIQEREFHRLGSTITRHADIRFIAATNRDLKKRIAEGKFLEDLYYRSMYFHGGADDVFGDLPRLHAHT